MRYDKLVRDRIPEIIRSRGEVPVTHVATAEEYRLKLHEKLQEEVAEFLANPCVEELADIQEVLFAVMADRGISQDELERVRVEKAESRGAFQERIILESTSQG